MSAWLVSKTHIDTMVTAMLGWEMILPEQATEIGRTLWNENVLSLEYRYPRDAGDHAEYRAAVEAYEFEAIEGLIDPRVIEKACHCLDYQSCEHDGWTSSAAYALTVQLCEIAMQRKPEHNRRFGKLADPSYGSPAYLWGIDHRDVFLAAAELRAGVPERSTT